MIECPRCGSCVRHENAAHECGERPDPYREQHPWFGMVIGPDGTEEVVHEDTHYRMADGSYIRKDEL